MIAFWISAAGLSAAAGALVLRNAARSSVADGVPSDIQAHKKQLTEIDRLAEGGLLDAAERDAARAEAGRRLLSAAETVEIWDVDDEGRRRIAVLAAILGPLAAVLVYIQIGAPALPDQPYAKRVAEWRATDPSQLEPEASPRCWKASPPSAPTTPNP
jgi:cytochrome c-type biogenesis protein CcmH